MAHRVVARDFVHHIQAKAEVCIPGGGRRCLELFGSRTPDKQPENHQSGEDDPHQSALLGSWLATHCGEKGDNKNPTKGKPQCVAMSQNL